MIYKIIRRFFVTLMFLCYPIALLVLFFIGLIFTVCQAKNWKEFKRDFQDGLEEFNPFRGEFWNYMKEVWG